MLPLRSAREVIETYYDRWAIEVLFRDLKQLLGFAASRARTKPAVLRTTPWVGLNYTVLVLWYLKLGARLPTPVRPWYRKHGICFADVLRHAQRQLGAVSWSDPRRALDDLRRQRAQPRSSALAG